MCELVDVKSPASCGIFVSPFLLKMFIGGEDKYDLFLLPPEEMRETQM
jgi:hypothetical protein